MLKNDNGGNIVPHYHRTYWWSFRGLVGITKNQTFTPDKFTFQWKYFATTMFVSAVVGVMSGIIADGDWRISLLAGYAGTDFLENLYKLRFAQFFKTT